MRDFEGELRELSVLLDADEYDDQEEWEVLMDTYYPERVEEVAAAAAKQGSTVGMHLYGRLLMRRAAKLKGEPEEKKALLAESKEWIKKAAFNGCAGAVDDLGSEQVGRLPITTEEELAFFAVNNGGIDSVRANAEYLRRQLGCEISESSVAGALELFEEVARHHRENQISLRMCDCIFL